MDKRKIKKALSNEILKGNLKSFVENYKIAKCKAFEGLDFDKIRKEIGCIKNYSYQEVLALFREFKENAEKKGCFVYEAKNSQDANNYILDICQKHNANLVVKSKSMTSEETHLNNFLEQHNIIPIETDLGEWILQLAKESPSHMVMPAIHKSRKEVAKLFKQRLSKDVDENDIEAMVKIARNTLRDFYFKAKVGITGANIAIAETGTIAIVTNEGNARLTTTIPDIHIVLLGYDKLVKTFEDALKIIRTLPKSATGQIITTYVTWISGTYPSKNQKEVHFVFLDNGRLPILKNPRLKEALKCIRCGSCANVCPVYEVVGGHVFGSTYVGAIGLILASFYEDEKIANEIMKMCIGCKSCSVNCPANIDLASLILDINATITERHKVPMYKKFLYSHVIPNPDIFSKSMKVAKAIQKPLAKNNEIQKLPFFPKDINFRHLPIISKYTFSKMYKKFYKPTTYKKYKDEVLFYPGCAIEYFYPHMGMALVKIMDALDIKVSIPKKQVCCGLPSIHAGFKIGGERSIFNLLDYFDENIDKDIIVLCPSCGITIKDEFLKYTKTSPKNYKKSIYLAKRVKSLSQFLEERNIKFKLKQEVKFTYHTPCHQKRGILFSTENFLKNNFNHLFIQLNDSDKCCGFGGSFSFDFPEISKMILDDKIKNIQKTNAEIVVTDCPGCILQIKGGISKQGLNHKVLHLSEFLDLYTNMG